MKGYNWLFVSILLTFMLGGCGGSDTSGTPGTEGFWNPQFVRITGYYCDGFGSEDPVQNDNVDAFFDSTFDCTSSPILEPEVFTDHSVRVAMYNRDLFGIPGSATPVTISRIDIEYRRPEFDAPGAPILQSRRINETIVLPPVTDAAIEAGAEPTVFYTDLVDLATKQEYEEQITSGERIPPVEFLGTKRLLPSMVQTLKIQALEVSFTVEFNIGNFDYCQCVN